MSEEEPTMAELTLYQFALLQEYPMYRKGTTVVTYDPIGYLEDLTGKRNDEFIRKTAASALKKMWRAAEREKGGE